MCIRVSWSACAVIASSLHLDRAIPPDFFLHFEANNLPYYCKNPQDRDFDWGFSSKLLLKRSRLRESSN